MAVSSYLAVYLIQVYRMNAGEIAFPLMLAGLGVIAGSILGGHAASHEDRLSLISIFFLISAPIALLVFTTHISVWITAVLSFVIICLLLISAPVTALQLTQWAGESRATATGMFTVSNQLGIMGGASIGGLMLSLGSFPLIGVFCSVTAATAAALVRYKVQGGGDVVDYHD